MEEEKAGIGYVTRWVWQIFECCSLLSWRSLLLKWHQIAIFDTDIVIVIMFHVKLGGAVRWRRFWMFDGLWRSFQWINRLSAGVRHSQVAWIIIMPTFRIGSKKRHQLIEKYIFADYTPRLGTESRSTTASAFLLLVFVTSGILDHHNWKNHNAS